MTHASLDSMFGCDSVAWRLVAQVDYTNYGFLETFRGKPWWKTGNIYWKTGNVSTFPGNEFAFPGNISSSEFHLLETFPLFLETESLFLETKSPFLETFPAKVETVPPNLEEMWKRFHQIFGGNVSSFLLNVSCKQVLKLFNNQSGIYFRSHGEKVFFSFPIDLPEYATLN